jgi:hypothetical protein
MSAVIYPASACIAKTAGLQQQTSPPNTIAGKVCGIPPNHHKSMLSKEESGAPGAIRTPDPQIRSLVLYPAELRVLAFRRSCPAVWRSTTARFLRMQASFVKKMYQALFF